MFVGVEMFDDEEDEVDVVEADADLFGSFAFDLFNCMLMMFSSNSLYCGAEPVLTP